MSGLAALRRVEAMMTMALDLARGAYPAPVYGRAPRAGGLPPIFTFHGAVAELLEPVLARLAGDGYRTWTCDEYLAAVRGEAVADPSRSLMLAFDDGYASVWSVLYPLLRRYEMRAVVFLIPGRIQDGDGPGTAKEPLCTWPQIHEMHESGLLDFQSHTLLHHRVFVDTRIEDFVHPGLIENRHPHDLRMWDAPSRQDALPIEPSYPSPPLGAPIYASRPRMVADRAVHEDLDVREACVSRVREGGGARFFERPDWRRELLSVTGSRGGGRTVARAETTEERDRELLFDLETARRLIEARLPGKEVRHVAWPWGVASEAAVRAARAAGYEACYWGRVDGRLANAAGEDPMRLARIGEDFVRCLPGSDRVGLPRLLLDKLRRRTPATAGRSDGASS